MSRSHAVVVSPIAWRTRRGRITRRCGRAFRPRHGVSPNVSSWWTRRHRSRSFISRFARRSSVSWKRVRGHDVLVRAFERAVQRGRLAHAYLFTGPPGVGKRLFAVELAKSLL